MAPDTEQRHFTRIPFDADAQIIDPASNTRFSAKLLDISLKGALTTQPENWREEAGKPYQLELQLADTNEGITLNMTVTVAHTADGHIGFHCAHMDLDTATHLHRLVELNLGDEKLLERELAELVGP